MKKFIAISILALSSLSAYAKDKPLPVNTAAMESVDTWIAHINSDNNTLKALALGYLEAAMDGVPAGANGSCTNPSETLGIYANVMEGGMEIVAKRGMGSLSAAQGLQIVLAATYPCK
jgi:hypothetical protein